MPTERDNQTNASTSAVPVGAVLAYAGKLNGDQLRSLGWSICDGESLGIGRYGELFQAIGTCNGGDGTSSFNLPNYQGYFLRGLDPTSTIDVDGRQRTSPASGGQTGANVGSIQGFATGAPKKAFIADVPHLPTEDHHNLAGNTDDMLSPGGEQTFKSSGGGDAETRPINAYVNFIIKLTDTASLLPGTVVAYAGAKPEGSPLLHQFYMLCNGESLPGNSATYKDLYAAIGTAHGGEGSNFNLPDYRGRFLRGADNGSRRDPEAASRAGMAKGGSTGDAVGSIQGYATASPHNPFMLTIPLGTHERESSYCAGHDNAKWNPGSVTVAFTAQGGDKESRPVNVTVDQYILSEPETGTQDLFPVGAIIAVPGKTPSPSDQWLLCDGASLPAAGSGQYAELYAAIGATNGVSPDGKTFNIPDYHGYFLRGTDHGQGRDADAATRTAARPGGLSGDNVGSSQGSATAKPVSRDITGEIPHLPTDDSENAATFPWSASAAEWDGDKQVGLAGGGDSESRPVNAYVMFYIKYASAAV